MTDPNFQRSSIVAHLKAAIEYAEQEKAKAEFDLADAHSRLATSSADLADLRKALRSLDTESKILMEAAVPAGSGRFA